MTDQPMVQKLLEIGQAVRDKLRLSLLNQTVEQRIAVAHESAGDTIYEIDKNVEDLMAQMLSEKAAELGGIALIAEGLAEEQVMMFPKGLPEHEAKWRVIIDPIDGTREIMYDKRSAFFLAGAAPNKGQDTSLQDIEVAVMVELTHSRSHLSDLLWAIKGQGAHRKTENLENGTIINAPIQPSKAKSIYGGFASISRFFPPGKDILSIVEEELVKTLFPDAPEGRAILFEDQYISTGGQLWEMLLGHDRFIADLRGGLYRRLTQKGKKVGMAAHPYDLCTQLVATEAGIIITDIHGNPLDAPFDTTSDIDWIGYANQSIQQEVEPVLREVIKVYKLI